MTKPVLELRVAITVQDYQRMVEIYQQGLGLEPAEIWTDDTGSALIFEMGRGTLEIFDEQHAANVDAIEAGQRVSGPVRFALEVPDLQAALTRLLALGATQVHEPIITPWNHHNVRLQFPDGMQVTLFQVMEQAGS
jgi:catechol 2,3-dioxygenase-like lactoylglutathione lyase family enzyme